jgi:hypothetical protein
MVFMRQKILIHGFLLACLTLIPQGMLQAQAPVPYRVSVFTDVRMQSEADNSTYRSVLARNMTTELENRGYGTVPGGELSLILPGRELPEQGAPEADTINSMRRLAVSQSSSYFCLVRYIQRGDSLEFSVYFWRGNGGLIVSYSTRDAAGLAVYNRLNAAVGMFIDKAGQGKSAEIAGGGGGAAETSRYVKEIILYSKDEGAEIWLKGKEKLGVIKNGQLILPYMPLALGSTIEIEKKKPGSYDSSETLTLTQEKNEITLAPMERIYGSGLYFTWTTGQFVGLGVGYMGNVNERYIYWGVENYFFLQAGRTKDMHPVIHDDIRGFMLLKYRFAEGFPFTVSYSYGLGVIFSLLDAKGSPLYTDFYLNPANLHLEYAVNDYVIFLRIEYKIALGLGRNLLGTNVISIADGWPLFTLGVITRW